MANEQTSNQTEAEAETEAEARIKFVVSNLAELGAVTGFRFCGTGEFLTADDEILLPFGEIFVFVLPNVDGVLSDRIEKILGGVSGAPA